MRALVKWIVALVLVLAALLVWQRTASAADAADGQEAVRLLAPEPYRLAGARPLVPARKSPAGLARAAQRPRSTHFS
jgi:hypothetical protein